MMMVTNKLFFLILVLTCLACSGNSEKDKTASDSQTTKSVENEVQKEPKLLSPQDVKKMASEQEVIVLDVRTRKEAEQGMIEGAILMDFNSADFENRLDTLDKDKPYIVYCAVGGRSGRTASMMSKKGFKSVFDLEGGIKNWGSQGFPLVPYE